MMRETFVQIFAFCCCIAVATTYDGRCPGGLGDHVKVMNCNCYAVETDKTFFRARRCEDKGGMLAKITDSETNEMIKNMLHELYTKFDVTSIRSGAWIGARRSDKDAPFKWTDGSPMDFTNWADGEPDHLFNSAIEQNCVYMKRAMRWRWSSVQCGPSLIAPTYPAVCQYKMSNCTVSGPAKDKLGTGALIGIVVGSVIGGILLCAVVCCLVVKCRSACDKVKKRRSQRRSVRYYSRPPSTVQPNGKTEAFVEIGDDAVGDNDLNEQLVDGATTSGTVTNRNVGDGDDDSILNVKEYSLPTASSISAEVEERKRLVVDLATGRPTIKRLNAPSIPKPDTASTRSLKSFKMDGGDQLSNQVSMEENRSGKLSPSDSLRSVDAEEDEDGVQANLDNVDKPSTHPTKDFSYK